MTLLAPCQSRDRHTTYQAAWRHLRHLTRSPRPRHATAARRLTVYRCAWCNAWHVGSLAEKERAS